MPPAVLFAGIAGLALLAGMAPIIGLKSLTFAFAWVLRPFWMPTWLDNLPVQIYLACLVASTFVLLLSGIPAALYERLWLGERGGNSSLLVWLLAAALVTALTVRP